MDACRDRRGGIWDSVLLVVDRCTKYVLAIPGRRNDTAQIVWQDLLDGVFTRFGVPATVTSDQDPKFTCRWFQGQAAGLGVRWAFGAAGHAQTDGQSERFVRTVKSMLHTAESEHQSSTWVELLSGVLFAYNCTPHSRTGEAPHTLVYGYTPEVLPYGLAPPPTDLVDGTPAQQRRRMDEAIQLAQGRYRASQERMLAGTKRSPLPKVGLWVSVWNRRAARPGEWMPARVGPFRVHRVGTGGRIELETEPGVYKVENVMNVKPFHAPDLEDQSRTGEDRGSDGAGADASPRTIDAAMRHRQSDELVSDDGGSDTTGETPSIPSMDSDSSWYPSGHEHEGEFEIEEARPAAAVKRRGRFQLQDRTR